MPTHAPDTSCPQARRTFSRRKMIAKWQRSKRWKDLVDEHAHTSDAVCVHCGRHHGQVWTNSKGEEKIVKLTINHTDRICYTDEDLYLTWDPEKMEIACLICNWNFERGMKPCPSCLKKGRYSPIKWYDDECTKCYYESRPELAKQIKERKEQFEQAIKDYNAKRAQVARAIKVKHPCVFRSAGIGQKCRLGGACPHSPKKAPLECKRGFKPKKKMELKNHAK